VSGNSDDAILNRKVKVGDVITLQLKEDKGDDDNDDDDDNEGGGIAVDGMLGNGGQEPSLGAQLRQVEEKLRNTQDRAEIVTLMRKRGELQRKYQTEQAMIASTCTSPLSRNQRSSSPMMMTGGSFSEKRDKDERLHSYRIIHMGQGIVTLDRPGNINWCVC
jgi:hypothetical protein